MNRLERRRQHQEHRQLHQDLSVSGQPRERWPQVIQQSQHKDNKQQPENEPVHEPHLLK